jgi:diguanylate cyclase (GGDEF)-like protein
VLAPSSAIDVGPVDERDVGEAFDLIVLHVREAELPLAKLLEVQREFAASAIVAVVPEGDGSGVDAMLGFGAHAALGDGECTPRGLLRAVRYALLRRDAEVEIERLRLEDTLTGLPNVHAFTRDTALAIRKSERGRRSFAVAVLDIDGFRDLNQRLGRHAGDELLREIASRLVDGAGDGVAIARRGDDQFLLRIEGAGDAAEAQRRVTAVLEAVSRAWSFGEQELRVSITAGVAQYPADGERFDRLLEVADAALRGGKRRELGRAHVGGAVGAERASGDRSLAEALREALSREEFVLHYQPQFDLRTHELAGVEAFLRWARPGFGLVHAASFVRALEASGAMVDVERWVLHTACRQLRAWRELTGRRFRMAVNVSARHFADPDLPRTVDMALRSSGLPTGALELEITERVAMQDVQASLARIEELDAVGATVVVDDFGTGASSLKYLRRFAIDAVKIDHTFVSELSQGRDGEHVTRGIVALARAFDLRVVAEGVEGSGQVEQLRAIGCTEAQGHFFGAPEAATQLEAKLVHELGAGWGGLRRDEDPTRQATP